MLTTIDFFIIGAYIFSVILIGYFASRKQSSESFLISERKLGTFSSFSSINATKTGAIIFIFTALLYDYGFSAMWYFIGIVLGYLVFLPFSKSLFRKSNARYYTLADYFHENYGTLSGRLASVITIVTMVGFLIINLIATAKVLQFFAGTSFAVSAIVVAIVVMLYLLLAGFSAVVKTDVLQYLAIIFVLTTFAFVLSGGIDIPGSEWNLVAAGGRNVFGFLLIGLLFPFASPDLWQRVYAMPNQNILRKSILFSVVVFAVVAFILALVGLFVKTAMPALDPDIALIHGLSALLPVGLIGLAVVVFFGALMSSIDTYAYTASSALVHDFFKKLSKESTVSFIRVSIAGTIVISTIISIFLQDLIQASFIFAAFVVVLAVPTIITWIRPNVKRRTLNSTLVVGTTLLVIFIALGLAQDDLSPTIVIKGIAGSLAGLAIGFIYSKLSNEKSLPE
jgi:Na+/proline symporter